MIKNTLNGFGWLSIALHWISAILIIGLFALGFWMVELNYMSPWYITAPDLHISFGLLLLALTLARLIWLFSQPAPQPLETHSRFEKFIGRLMHRLLYFMIFAIIISGYLISTANGHGVLFFELFELPAAGELFDQQADKAGWFHQMAAYLLMGLVLLHALAAIKHHIIDKDNSLRRILKSGQ